MYKRQGDIQAARRILDEIPAAPGEGLEADRIAIRRAWVACEIALAVGDAARALAELDRIDGLRSEWPRHVAKTALFRGVSLRTLGRASDAQHWFERAVAIAEPLGARPIVSVARSLAP